MSDSCATCLYYEPAKQVCRRNPPVALVKIDDAILGTVKVYSGFPTIEADDWCGEWAPIPS